MVSGYFTECRPASGALCLLALFLWHTKRGQEMVGGPPKHPFQGVPKAISSWSEVPMFCTVPVEQLLVEPDAPHQQDALTRPHELAVCSTFDVSVVYKWLVTSHGAGSIAALSHEVIHNFACFCSVNMQDCRS